MGPTRSLHQTSSAPPRVSRYLDTTHPQKLREAGGRGCKRQRRDLPGGSEMAQAGAHGYYISRRFNGVWAGSSVREPAGTLSV